MAELIMNPVMSSAAKLKEKAELPALTGLRFFAAIYVVCYHFFAPSLRTSIWPLANIFSGGYCAVGFFFLLSGFVLTYSYVRRDGSSSIDRVKFWKARFQRIYPAYLFAFLLAAPFQIRGSILTNGLPLAIKKLTVGAALVLTLLQAWTPQTAWYWNIPAWSLSVEVFFYFCFPFAVLLIAAMRPKDCLRWSGALWLVGLAGPVLYCTLQPVALHPPFSMGQLALETNPLARLPEFLIGMLVGRIFVGGFRLSTRLASVLSFVALACLGLLVGCSSAVPRLLFSNSILVPASALLIFALAHQSGWIARALGHPILRLPGEASYSIYILQYPVSYLLHFNTQTFSVTRGVFYLAVLITLSIFTFLFIEQPLRRRLRARKRLISETSLRAPGPTAGLAVEGDGVAA